MKLETDEGEFDVPSSKELVIHLLRLDSETNNRAILSTGDECYIQTAMFANGFSIEKRDGNAQSHARAVPKPARAPLPAPPMPKQSWIERVLSIGTPRADSHPDAFTRDELIALFTAYFEGQPEPDWLRWEEITL